jgi:nicotinamidase-related amidase
MLLTLETGETTARSAFNRGFETYLVSDACGANDPVLHEGTLRAIRAGFGEVLTTKEVLERL